MMMTHSVCIESATHRVITNRPLVISHAGRHATHFRVISGVFFVISSASEKSCFFMPGKKRRSLPAVEMTAGEGRDGRGESRGDFFKVELQQVVQVTFPITPPITPPISGVDQIPVTDLERRILLLLHDTPTLTGSSLAEDLGIRRGTVKEYLGRLKAKGLLVREGSTRTGRWRLTAGGRAAIDRDE